MKLPFLIFALGVSQLGAATPSASPGLKPAPGTPPNIVFIVSDDHSFPYLGSYGYPVKTPNLDRFAAEGMVFTRMFTTAPQCAPSRASFATGRSSVAVRASRFSAGVPREIIMFPEILRREAGYYTGICRRAHHLDGWTDPAAAITRNIWQQHNLQSVPERFDFVKMGGNHTETSAYVTEFLDQVPAGKPFCLWVNFSDPHHPWNAPVVHNPAEIPLPADWPDLPELRHEFATYLDEIARLDGEFQSVLDTLDRRGLRQNTLIVFVGDNGMPLPRGKGALYEHGLNVPLLVSWPGRIAPGARSAALISGEDFAPTFLAAAGLTPPKDMTGQNFLPLLRGDAAYQARLYLFAMRGVHGASVFNERTPSSGYDLGRMVRSDRYKLIINYTPFMPYAPTDTAIGPGWKLMQRLHESSELPSLYERLYFKSPRPIIELFDLQADPAELNNLAGRPELATVQHELMVALQEKMIVDYDYLPLPLRE